LDDHHPLEAGNRPQLDPVPRFAGGEAEAILNRLQRNGGALTSCECGSRNWLPPDGIYQLVAVAGRHPHQIPAKAVVPLTCAACGFTKLYDPAVVASLAESTGRW
jgi:predicted nucleic-acid-binding Zn-ribbon protein